MTRKIREDEDVDLEALGGESEYSAESAGVVPEPSGQNQPWHPPELDPANPNGTDLARRALEEATEAPARKSAPSSRQSVGARSLADETTSD